jgi:hypothetical protein
MMEDVKRIQLKGGEPYIPTREAWGGFLKRELRRSSKLEHSMGHYVIENVLKSCTNELA